MSTMKCLTVQPGVPDSLQLEEFRVPPPERGGVLVRALALGVCGTDREIIAAKYGTAPPGHKRLIIGHESLGRVEEAPAGSELHTGDLVVGIVRHPDPVPCVNCAVGEWDMCRNGEYTEHGIKSLDGFGSEYYRLEPTRVVRIDPRLGLHGVLVEPTSVVAKAWEHVERIGARATWRPERVLITGAGPVGLLGALLGAQRHLDVHVFDRATGGLKPDLVAALGGTFHNGDIRDLPRDFDIVLECTGAPPVVAEVLAHTAANAVVCLLGVSDPGKHVDMDLGALNRDVVLGNRVIFGSVNANRRQYESAVRALEAADPAWLDRLITRRVPLDEWRTAFARQQGDVKTIIQFAPA